MTIAVGVTDQPTNVDTLAWAVTEAAALGGRLVVCHVCPPSSMLAGHRGPVSLAVLELADPALARAVAAARGRLGDRWVDLVLATGPVGPALIAAARDADLLVVGAPQHAGWAERASTTHHVVRHATGPVVVVRSAPPGGTGPFAGHVVAGVDGSDSSIAALGHAFAFADAHRRPLAAVHVTTSEPEGYWFDEEMLEAHLVVEPAGMTMLSEQVEPWQRSYPQVAVKRALYAGRPLRGLLRAALGARLLVVGDHGRGPAARVLLGSVSHGAVDRAPCPVAIVPAVHVPVPVP